MARKKPSRGMLIRDRERKRLAHHFYLLLIGVAGLFIANRFVSPGTLWAHWPAGLWVIVFIAHLASFSKRTLATMGGNREG